MAGYRSGAVRVGALLVGSLVLAVVSACSDPAPPEVPAAPPAAAAPADWIEGTVTNAAGGAEAGVWVVAQTDGLPTPLRKIVVTDDAGRFVLPQLPDADYQVWVRGYGLADSARTPARPGAAPLALTVQAAATPAEAAHIYPASHWLAMLDPPDRNAAWMSQFKLNCQLCHQVGSLLTRVRTREGYELGLRKATAMNGMADGLGRERLLDALAAWSGRIQAGEVPEAPPRPQGAERNMVITQWDWGDGYTYAHDEIATDKRNPTLYPNGPIWGVDLANDRLLAVDPVAHTASAHAVPTRDGFDTPWCTQTWKPADGAEPVVVGFGSLGCPVESGITPHEGQYPNPANPHNPMMDAQGRVWMTTQIRREWGEDLPAFCRDAPELVNRYHHRQLGWFDPATGKTELIDTCFGTHHLQFDANGVLWTSGDSYVIGWFDPARYDPARPETLEQAQGWSEVVVDSDGDGKADLPRPAFNYGVIPNPVDGSVWLAQPAGDVGAPLEERGRLIRFDPATRTHEAYTPPAPGAGPRGVDVDSTGIIWASLGGSGHLAKFDRSRCAQTWGAGEQCPEGWTLYRSPGPLLKTDEEQGADFHYYLFVDQFDTLGMGKDVVVMNGTGSDSLLAFDPRTEAFTVIRVPYPLNTYTRGLDGRIDDAAAGWKGRGLWFTNGLDPLVHSELPRSFVGKVQYRPDPLAH
jgi:hypothetical protein